MAIRLAKLVAVLGCLAFARASGPRADHSTIFMPRAKGRRLRASSRLVRFPAFAQPASAGEARSEKVMLKQNARDRF